MSKRKITTGQPKEQRRTTAETETGREQLSRAEREAIFQRRIILGTGIAVGVVLLIMLIAVFVELVVTPQQAVASVNGETITVAQFEDRVRLERALLNQQINDYVALIQAQGLDPNQFAGQEPLRTWLSRVQVPDQLGNNVLSQMIGDTLIRQEAAARGITVSDEVIDARINDFFGYDPDSIGVEPTPTLEPTLTPTPIVSPTPSPEPTAAPVVESTEEAEATEEAADAEATDEPEPTLVPTLTAEEQEANFVELRDGYFNILQRNARLSAEQVRAYFEAQALRDALRDDITGDLGLLALHVDSRHILVETEEEALDILAALQEDLESFADLARAASTDTGSGQQGGELGWSPVSGFVGPFAEAVTDAEIGEIVGPVNTEFGYHIIQVRAREEREITEDALENTKNQRFDQWLADFRNNEENDITIHPIWVDHIPTDPVLFIG